MPQWGRLSLPVHSEVCSRAHCYVEDVAERSEQKSDDEQFCFVEGCQRAGDELSPLPSLLATALGKVLCSGSSPTHVYFPGFPLLAFYPLAIQRGLEFFQPFLSTFDRKHADGISEPMSTRLHRS
jgi:hypothetical protein